MSSSQAWSLPSSQGILSLECSDLGHRDLKHYGVARDVQKLLQDYRSSQDIIAILRPDEPLEKDKMKVAEILINNPGKLVHAVKTTAGLKDILAGKYDHIPEATKEACNGLQ